MPRLLVAVAARADAYSREEDAKLRAAGRLPAVVDEDALGADSLSLDELAELPGRRGALLRKLPASLAIGVEASRRRDLDAVLSWGEPTAWPVALACMLRRRSRRPRHVAILLHPFDESSPSALKRWVKRTFLGVLARRGIERAWIPAPVQAQRAVDEWGFARAALVPAEWSVDTDFWTPPADTPAEGDTICSVGREMRDYETLLEALRDTGVPCHIAAGTGWRNAAAGTQDERARYAGDDDLPPGVTSGPLMPFELRELYARSRFVVIPVMPSASDNGVSVAIEAMAMGRAVVATATEGRTELLEDGVNCVLVPPRDPAALRDAITRLWNDPAECARLGAAGRETAVARAGLAQWREAILAAAER